MKYLDWKVGAILLALILLIAVATVQPIGVSTQYVVADGLVLGSLLPDFITNNAYFAKYAAKMSVLSYGFMFVVGIFLGGLASKLTGGSVPKGEDKHIPAVWKANFGDDKHKRYLWAFIGGFLLLLGARMAGGCTSGHIISGVSQMAVSSLIFAIFVFIGGIFTAVKFYRKK